MAVSTNIDHYSDSECATFWSLLKIKEKHILSARFSFYKFTLKDMITFSISSCLYLSICKLSYIMLKRFLMGYIYLIVRLVVNFVQHYKRRIKSKFKWLSGKDLVQLLSRIFRISYLTVSAESYLSWDHMNCLVIREYRRQLNTNKY
jgi:hypothetical protein